MRRLVKKIITHILNQQGYGVHILSQEGHRVERRFNIPQKELMALNIAGWFLPEECRKLYETTLLTNGPILEIGHFLGKSTACICEALHDSGKSRLFNSYDLGFTCEQEFKEHYDPVHKTDVSLPPLYGEFVFSKGKITTDVARKNLQQIGLDGYVNLTSGNFVELDTNTYDFIFCDALHDPHEIKLNLPHVIAHSNPGCTWAFHDMNEEYIKLVLKLAECEYIGSGGFLGLFYFKG